MVDIYEYKYGLFYKLIIIICGKFKRKLSLLCGNENQVSVLYNILFICMLTEHCR